MALMLACLSRACFAQTAVGLDIIGTHGTHREASGSVRAPLVPAPLLRISARSGPAELHVEALSSFGAVPTSSNTLGMKSVALSYGDAVLRYWNRRNTFAVGAGEMLYDQQTKFQLWQNSGGSEAQFQRSRVAGVRYEADFRQPVRGGTLEFSIGLSPALHGRVGAENRLSLLPLPGFAGSGTLPPRTYSFYSPLIYESASQVDATLRYTRPARGFEYSYGLRYVDYNAAFTFGSRRPFADSNVFVMPFFSISHRIGR